MRDVSKAKSAWLRSMGVFATAVAIGFTGAAQADSGEARIRINVRDGMGTDFPIATTLSAGQQVEILEWDGEFVRVKTAAGDEGYLKHKYLANVEREQAAPEPEKMMASDPADTDTMQAAEVPTAPAVAAAGNPANSNAADDAVELTTVQVTGSAIRRVDLQNSLPVQVITDVQIERQGITNAGDLIESLPAMQGYTTASDSVGGNGGGIRTANLRAIGDQYTLSLLDGRRMAPADSGSSIDLSNIPLAAVEQVQLLTDGASALYGSDAIAGVVNFILKDEVDTTTITLRADRPQESGGESWSGSVVTGLGDLETDGFSLVASLSHEQQDQLAAADRDFADSGFVTFSNAGRLLYFENSSSNAIPGNVHVYENEDLTGLIRNFNPNAAANGQCAQQTTPSNETCRFDYTSTIEIFPETERTSLTLNGKAAILDSMTAYGTLMASDYALTARVAPYPTGKVPLPVDSALVQNEVFPHLTEEERAQVQSVAGEWRALPGGNRTTEYETSSLNLTAGVQGATDLLDYDAALTHAVTKTDQSYPTGWLLREPFVEAVSSGSINIFASQEDFSDSDRAALAPTVYSGPWDTVESTMTGLDAKVSMPLFDLGGGAAILAAGVDFRMTNYKRTIADANAQELLLFLSKDTPYELERSQYGLFAEMLMPLHDSLEATLSARFDDISAVEDKRNGGDIDAGDSAVTYKVSALWNATSSLAFRASYGTGFKAPSMREIGEPLSEFGVTSGTYSCPFAADDPLAQFCDPEDTQYDVFRRGSATMKFETSDQYTAGVVLNMGSEFSVTVDYWNIELEDLVERLTEQQIFANAQQYRDLFTTKTNLATGRERLAIIQEAVNAGTREQSGIDYAINRRISLEDAQLDLGFRGTYVIDAESSLTGSSLGQFGNDDAVIFRNIMSAMGTLTIDKLSQTLTAFYRSGYRDQLQTVEVLGTGVPLGQGPTTDVQLSVASYTTVDYNAQYVIGDNATISLGVENVFDRAPPLSLRTSGAGHQVGWDPRYVDPYGRTFYLQGEYEF